MVRINIINPKALTDQHLVAEYNEILMLLGYVKKAKKIEEIPDTYNLGKGHIKFFSDKLSYLKKRHELLKKEMIKRNFKPEKTINLKEFKKSLVNDWIPRKSDKKVIIKRLIEKLKQKPQFYRYYSKPIILRDQIKLIKEEK